VIKYLLENGADVNMQGAEMWFALDGGVTNSANQGGEYGTALQAASFWGRLEIVELLLEGGAKPDIQGENPFYICTARKLK
jgi:ankyrin repeat protein